MYNLTALGQSDTIFKLVLYANEASGNYLVGMFILIVFAVVLLKLMATTDFKNSLMTACFVGFTISAIMAFTQLVNFMFPLTFLIIIAFLGLLHMLEN